STAPPFLSKSLPTNRILFETAYFVETTSPGRGGRPVPTKQIFSLGTPYSLSRIGPRYFEPMKTREARRSTRLSQSIHGPISESGGVHIRQSKCLLLRIIASMPWR